MTTSGYFSTIGGLTVGWDMCGECNRHVDRCDCVDGPAEPRYLSRERDSADPPRIVRSTSAAA